MKQILIFLMILIGLSSIGLALPTNGIMITNCQVTPTVANCGQINVSCGVVDFSSSQGINRVEFDMKQSYIADIQPANWDIWIASRTSGTVKNGTWTAVFNLTPTSAEISQWYLSQVKVVRADAVQCEVMANYDGPDCFANFTISRIVDNNCSCGSNQISSDCTKYNRLDVTWEYDPICVDYYSNSYGMGCDYCDPLWTSSIGSCFISDYIKRTGVANKSYYRGTGDFPNGTYCCDQTYDTVGYGPGEIFNHNYGSDCTAPPDNDEGMSCILDSWLQKGDIYGENRNVITNYAGSKLGMTYSSMAQVTGMSGSTIQPIVFDLDGDGINEIFITKNSSIYVYSVLTNSLVLDSTISPGVVTGVPAIWGVDKIPGGNYWQYDQYSCSDGSLALCDAFLVVPVNNQLKLYGANFALNRTITLPVISSHNTYVNPNSAISCYQDYCYLNGYDVVNNDIRLLKIDMQTSSATYVSVTGTPGYIDTTKSVPLLGDSVVAYFYKTSSSVYGISMFDYLLVTENDLAGSGDIYGAILINDIVYYTFTYTVNTTAQNVLGKFDGVSTSFYTLWNGTVGSGCVSNPVAMSCGATAQTNTGQSIGVINYGPTYYAYACNRTTLDWALYPDSPAPTKTFNRVWALNTGYSVATATDGTWYRYSNNVWSQILGPNSIISWNDDLGCDKTATGKVWCAYRNTTAPITTYFVQYDPDANQWSLLLTTTTVGGFSTVLTCTYDENSYCYFMNGTTKLYRFDGSSVSLEGTSTTSVNQFIPSNEKIIMATGTYPNVFGIYEWSGMDFVNRGSAAITYGHFVNHIYESPSMRVFAYHYYWNAYTWQDNILWYNYTLGTFTTTNRADGDGGEIVAMIGVGGDIWAAIQTGIGSYPHLIRYNFGSSTVRERFNTTTEIEDMDYDENTGIGWAVGASGKLFQYTGGTGCIYYPVELSGSQARCFSGDLSPRNAITLAGSVCRIGGGVTAAQATLRWQDENMFSGAGLTSFASGDPLVSYPSNSIVISVDIDGDSYGDVLVVTPSSSSIYLSRAPAEPLLLSAVASITKLQPCTVDNNGFAQLIIFGKGYEATAIDYSVDWGDGCTSTADYPNFALTHFYNKNCAVVEGETTITAKMCDRSTSTCDTKTCSVFVNVTDMRAGACNIGEDGEFNWQDTITNHGWLFSTSELSGLTPITHTSYPGALIFYNDPSGDIIHTASCNKNTLTIDAKILVSVSSDFSITVGSSETGSGTGGTTLGILKFYRGYVQTTENGIDFYNIEQFTDQSGFLEYNIVIDLAAQQVFYYILSPITGEYVLMAQVGLLSANVNNLYNAYISLSYGGTGTVKIDYIRISGSGQRVLKLRPQTQTEAELAHCLGWKNLTCRPIEQLKGKDLAFLNASKGADMTSAYPDIYTLCSNCEEGYCDAETLRSIIDYKSDCYKQAFNYCVDIFYPGTIRGGNVPPGSYRQGSGIVYCQSVFALQLAVNRIGLPIISDIWNIVYHNLLAVLLGVGVLVIIVAVVSRRK
jgi:hypothetical protein